MFEVYVDMPYEGTFSISEFHDLEEARMFARNIVRTRSYDGTKLDKDETIGIKQEYSF